MDAPRPIRPLAEHVINQIAAGEVIERPASVVKELVENSVDAGATRIEVDIEDGGIERIVVSDNGCGIRGQELGAALTRHCTSKLIDATELVSIASLGFRGEALASIAAVAELRIVTRTTDSEHAWEILSVPGEALAAPRPARGNFGTRIEVARLFHHVPARKRFLKQARTEGLHVQRVVRQLAFARPGLAIGFQHGHGRGLRLPGGGFDEMAPRWQTLFGAKFCAQATAVDEAVAGIRVRGWIGDPGQAGAQSDLQYVAINGRVIRDRNLQHAVRAAFGEQVPAGSFPAYALALELAPTAVDVNVHPGKLEVRFVDLRSVHDVLHTAVRRALGMSEQSRCGDDGDNPVGVGERPEHYRASAPVRRPARAESTPKLKSHGAPGRPIALVAERYLLLAVNQGIAVIDLHGAWLAVLERRLSDKAAGQSRRLLIPRRLPPGSGAELSADRQLAQYGFVFDDLGPAGVVMRAVPAVLPAIDDGRLVDALAARGHGTARAIAQAVIDALDFGLSAHAERDAMVALEQASAACDFDLNTLTRELDESTLGTLFGG